MTESKTGNARGEGKSPQGDPPAGPQPRQVLVLARELLIASRIASAVKAAGLEPIRVADPASLEQQPHSSSTPLALVVDLTLPQALEAATAWASTGRGHVAAVAPHVQTQMIRSARSAGIDPVLMRSQIDSHLPATLRQWALETHS